MNQKSAYSFCCNLLFSLCLFLTASISSAQTPGLIIRDGNGAIPPASLSTVLDPNQDGYSSFTNNGYSTADVGPGISEIPYKIVFPFLREPLGDLRRGPTGRFSDIVYDSAGTGFYIYFDAANSRILMRLRIGSIMSGSKGYSTLFDTDGKFSSLGPDADPTYQAQTTGINGNPGFEYEVVYETNFRIAVYDVNNSCGISPNPVWTIDLSANPGYAQTSIAFSTVSGNPDYFYDWWIPLSAFSGSGGPITPSTPLRVQTTTVMAPKGAICGPKSDIYGPDDMFKSAQAQYEASILAQPFFSLNNLTPTGAGIGPVCTEPPVITIPGSSSFSPSVTSISGTSSEPNGTVISFYRIRSGITSSLTTTSSPISVSAGTWSATLNAGQLLDGDIFYTKAQATGKSLCLKSNIKNISSCNPSTAPVAPAVCFAKKGITVTRTNVNYSVIFYLLSNSGEVEVGRFTPPATNSNADITFDATNVYYKGGCVGGPGTTNGTYKIVNETTVAPVCQSAPVYGCVSAAGGQAAGNTATPSITTNPIIEGTTEVAGNLAVSSATNTIIRLYVNGLQMASTIVTAGTTSWSISNLKFTNADIVTATAQDNVGGTNSTCMSAATANYTVQCYTAPPIINADASGKIKSGIAITGVINAAVGTTIRVYTATNVLVATVTVAADSTWTTAPFIAVAGISYYASAQRASCGISGNSGTISSVLGNTTDRCNGVALFSAATYYENGATTQFGVNSTTISGTLGGAAVANTQVILYLDDSPIDTITTNTNAWTATINNVYYNKIYAGGVITIGVSEPGKLESICATNRTILCQPPVVPIISSLNGSPGTIPGTINYTITNTQLGILYSLEDNINGSNPSQTMGKDRSPSKFGNGGSLILTSYVFPEPGYYNLRITAIKLSGADCEIATLLNNVAPLNTTFAINDENSTWQGMSVSGNVLRNDYDPEGNTQNFSDFLLQNLSGTISSGSQVNGIDKTGVPFSNAGTITFDINGNYTFAPAANFTGTVSIPNKICDNGNPSVCDTAYLTITVNPLNNAGINSVIANNDENISFGNAVSNNLLLNDADPQFETFSITSISAGTIGTAGVIAGIDQFGNPVANAGTLIINSNGNYTFTPTVGFYGNIEITYTITDASGATAIATLQIFVIQDSNAMQNDPPFAADDFGFTIINTAITGSFINNDSDPNNNSLSLNGTTIVPAGPATVIGAPVATAHGGSVQFYANGTYLYTPATGYSGPDLVSYTICDVTVVAPQPLCNEASIHLLVGSGFTISGSVLNDIDGLTNSIIDGTGTNAGASLFVSLVDASNNIVATTAVAANGTYSFSGVNIGNYTLVLHQTAAGSLTPALPAGWVNTGEGTTASGDATINGMMAVTISTADVSTALFGIEQPPVADDHTTTITYPTINQLIALNGGSNPPILSGSDPEDCNSGCNLTNRTIVINSIPIESELYYNGVLVTDSQQINNFNPSLLQIKITTGTVGYSSTSFTYSFVDAAGFSNAVPAIYTLNWFPVLPVTGLNLTASMSGNTSLLKWQTISEFNTSYFEIERSTDNRHFILIGNRVMAAGNSAAEKQYQLTDDIRNVQTSNIIYYRVKLTDIDGKITYSNIVVIKFNKSIGITTWPNPFKSAVTININSNQNSNLAFKLTDIAGKTIVMESLKTTSGTSQISLNGLGQLTKGIYILYINDKNTDTQTVLKLMKE